MHIFWKSWLSQQYFKINLHYTKQILYYTISTGQRIYDNMIYKLHVESYVLCWPIYFVMEIAHKMHCFFFCKPRQWHCKVYSIYYWPIIHSIQLLNHHKTYCNLPLQHTNLTLIPPFKGVSSIKVQFWYLIYKKDKFTFTNHRLIN